MPRSSWNGTLSFGLIHLPVSLFTAVRDQDVKFRQLCAVHRRPISMKRYCDGPHDADPPVPHEVDDVISGIEHVPGSFVTITKDERAATDGDKSVFGVRTFVARDSLDPRLFSKPYLVLPQKPAAARAYALFREALARTGKMGIGLLTLRTKQQMAAVRAEGDIILLHALHWPDELVSLGEFVLPPATELAEAEVGLAVQFIERTAGALATADFRDGHRERLERLILARAEGAEPEPEHVPAASGPAVTDLVALLQASLAAA